MSVAEKLRYLRAMEGQLRGLNRPMTQREVVDAIQSEQGRKVSQSYLSQLESGHRRHLTNTSRLLLSRFFSVHPGYLVDDPEGFQTELLSDLAVGEDKFDLWLVSGAERFRRDPALARAMLKISSHADSRGALLLLAEILETPDLASRLWEVLRPTSTKGEHSP